MWPWVCLQFVIVVFSDHNHLLFVYENTKHCNILIIQGECLKALKKMIFTRAWVIWSPGIWLAVGDRYTLLHTKYIWCGPHYFR